MYKAILMSIRPQHLVKILNGEKTIEIRKTMPKCELPIDVYLYCTKGKPLFRLPTNDKKEWFVEVPYGWVVDKKTGFNGKVVAKFTLNKIEDCCDMSLPELENKSLLNINEICSYIKAKEVDPKTVYAWHINNLKIFNKPMELGEFSTFKRETISCGMDCPPYTDWVEYRVRKAPKSWRYAYVKDFAVFYFPEV
ncbi:MAG TPA: hypothetical protein VJZ51_02745 [Bacilli bacterium]|nr:hypothetical protein [Bacilli bacterium]